MSSLQTFRIIWSANHLKSLVVSFVCVLIISKEKNDLRENCKLHNGYGKLRYLCVLLCKHNEGNWTSDIMINIGPSEGAK